MSEKLRPIIVIPARLAASRLPNKPLASIGGVPMIVQCLKRAQEADIAEVLVAAGDQEIVDAVQDYEGKAILTDPDLASGSDRVETVLRQFDPTGRFNFVVNFQGDLPLFDPRCFQDLLRGVTPKSDYVRTLAAIITDKNDIDSSAVVKVRASFSDYQLGSIARVLSFSRTASPNSEEPYLHHIGIYGFPREILHKFVQLPPSPSEKREKLEQMRLLENGYGMEVALVKDVPISVDVPADLEKAKDALNGLKYGF